MPGRPSMLGCAGAAEAASGHVRLLARFGWLAVVRVAAVWWMSRLALLHCVCLYNSVQDGSRKASPARSPTHAVPHLCSPNYRSWRARRPSGA